MSKVTIPRTAVLVTLISASLIWLAVATALGLVGPVLQSGWLFRATLAAAALVAAEAAFRSALHLCSSARASRVERRLAPVRIPVRARRIRR